MPLICTCQLCSFFSAAHHSFFWLLAFREALVVVESLVAKGQSLETITAEVKVRQEAFDKKHPLPANSHATNFPDHVKW